MSGSSSKSTTTLLVTPTGPDFSSEGSSHFYFLPSDASSITLLPDSASKTVAYGVAVETRIKPCLTVILSMTTDMWCGKVSHHDPPLLIVGSRSSPAKLATVTLTRDIIDPSKTYNSTTTPALLSPKNIAIQDMSVGYGHGVMCIDADASRLIVGCTGGSIQVMNMDPTKQFLPPLTNNNAPPVITLPHLTRSQTDSTRSISSIHLSSPDLNPTAAGVRKDSSAEYLKKTQTAAPADTARTTGLPTPENSPRKASLPIKMSTAPGRGIRGISPPRTGAQQGKRSMTPPTDHEEQEVLADCDEDEMRSLDYRVSPRSDSLIQEGFHRDGRTTVATTFGTSSRKRSPPLPSPAQ
ncbi:hypothetical protein BC939DRAFT_449166 [Gamsiella multidivaricata]|uniref:uncharacterized protein n=1 Tax=Gamsiella multidivaricata TaxID=101098 RepID=UPI002220F27F|nr:uncharacterized protein BC939DRAFT_449166 [Gamsiella multidivaricata]KAI7824756.1 hypothetical protein BC939DRAFT_449166 [Gamsiella multidivaricata]